ncbi:hypothetical protein ACOPJQ_08665 [Luteimonas dalianensis]|uniref:hypothetical protein n=1 Tax=Luteimonas dalianensis TaxID=1148196 RepID=UPI003BF42CAC
MSDAIHPYSAEGFEELRTWSEEGRRHVETLRSELERRHEAAGTSLDEALKEFGPPGLLEAAGLLGEDMEAVNGDPSPAAFYRYQFYLKAQIKLVAQAYMLELARTQPKCSPSSAL